MIAALCQCCTPQYKYSNGAALNSENVVQKRLEGLLNGECAGNPLLYLVMTFFGNPVLR